MKRVHCKNFNGVINARCRAGIVYPAGHIDQCIGRGYDPVAPCPRVEYLTPEEIEAKEREHKARQEEVKIARRAIVESIWNGTGRGRMTCPICHVGTLFYERSSNGHIHARCSTDNCVAWME